MIRKLLLLICLPVLAFSGQKPCPVEDFRDSEVTAVQHNECGNHPGSETPKTFSLIVPPSGTGVLVIGTTNVGGGVWEPAQFGFGAAVPIVHAGSWTGDAVIASKNGLKIGGPIGFYSTKDGNMSLDLDYCTGLNNPAAFQQGCDVANNSGDTTGEFWLAAAAGAATTGTVQLFFSQAWPSNVACQLTLIDEDAEWANGATVKMVAPLGAGRTRQNALRLQWSNNGVAPASPGPGGKGVGILYFCYASP